MTAVAAVQRRIDALGRSPGVEQWTLAVDAGCPIDALHLRCEQAPPQLRVLVTAGVHGNEPGGTDAALDLVGELRDARDLRPRVALTVVPLLAPGALASGTRRLPGGVDLNRCFRDDETALAGVRAVQALLQRQAFDLALDLHRGGARRDGFWVLQHGALELMTRAMRVFGERWPVLAGDCRPYRMLAPGVGASGRAATLKNYLARRGVPRTATLEAPASLSRDQQVRGLVALARIILDEALATAS